MTNTSAFDLNERLEILEAIYVSIIDLNNEEIYSKLARYRSNNVQWILNNLDKTFCELRDVLEMEELNHQER
jgi:hypothetical protein